MASKPPATSALPPHISLADHVLSSRITLPLEPCVVYSRFIPDPSSSARPQQSIELARRAILSKNTSASLLESYLSSIHVGASSFIYVFLVSAKDRLADASSAMSTLSFDGLTTPITLLPHGVPAFFLNHYSGPTSALTKQFQESLHGLGVSGWETTSCTSLSTEYLRRGNPSTPEYIIAWISVENKQGEDKGITLIYPTALCLSFTPSVSSGAQSRLPLDYIPELPAPLQASPNVSAASPAPLVAAISGLVSADSYPSSPSAVTFPSKPLLQPLPRPFLPSSPTSDSITAFRALTLSKSKDIRQVASEVGSYVDAVARERERERERLKRERETGASHSPKSARAIATAAAPSPTTTVPTDPATSMLTTPSNDPQPDVGPILQPPLHPTTAQNFYPSPPQSNVPVVPLQSGQSLLSTTITSLPALETSTIPTSIAAADGTPAATQPPSSSFDPFGSNETSWTMQPQSYLSMNMDMDMDFDMGMGLNMGFGMDASRGGGYDNGSGNGIDFDDSAFTDDDFSFFDRPSAPARSLSTSLPLGPSSIPIPTHLAINPISSGSGSIHAVTQTPLSIVSSPLYVSDVHLSGPGPPQQTPTPHASNLPPSPWVSADFTPRFTNIDGDADPPDLLPPSPCLTPQSHSSVPATPIVHLHLESEPNPTSAFDPIPFATYHRTLDNKYAMGKFSLPSPPYEEDHTESNFTWQLGTSSHVSVVSSTGGRSGTTVAPIVVNIPNNITTTTNENTGNDGSWRLKYMAATDPRIGVVRKLIGVKRKMNFEPSGRPPLTRHPSMPPSWIREHEEWENNHSEIHVTSEASMMPDEFPEEDSEEDMDDGEDSAASPLISRPSTPSPAYLPLGPTLLHTQFQHAELLGLSTPLRPPGAAVAPSSISSALSGAASVPTPVSPAAMLGAASERSKSLEAAAFTVAAEVVENSLWARAWRASTLAGVRKRPDIWLADVQWIVQLLKAIPGLESTLNLGTLFGLATTDLAPAKLQSPQTFPKPFRILEMPLLSVGKGDAVIQILPPATRFWQKIGLGPRGGKKNGNVIIVFEEGSEQREQQVEAWLATVIAAYEGLHLGTLVPGKSPTLAKSGIYPVRFDSTFRKSLASLMTNLPASQCSLIFLVVTPIATMTLASPVLRQVFSAVRKAAKTYSEAQIHFQLVPEQMIHGNFGNPSATFSDVDFLVVSIYNRILVPVDRAMSRRFFEFGERVRKYFQEPALTLARPVHNKVSFVRAPHASLDVMDRNTFLHVGYQVTPCGKWILAACIDQRGEAHELGVWLTQSPDECDTDEVSQELYLVKKIWDFTVSFARRANVEWRVTISRLGIVAESELDEAESPWTICSSRSKPKTPTKAQNLTRSASTTSKSHHPQNIFTDISTIIYATSPYNTLPQSHPPTFADLGLTLSLIPEPLSSSCTPEPQPSSLSPIYPHPLGLLPRSTTTLVCLPASPSPVDITMMHIHLLFTMRPTPHAVPEDIPSLHSAITQNFHELAVLANIQSRLGVSPMLPYHLGAVEAMHVALDCDQYGLDTTD
ncbi:hypothetical protein H0H81_000801, partial [Sphagnurus paluster]